MSTLDEFDPSRCQAGPATSGEPSLYDTVADPGHSAQSVRAGRLRAWPFCWSQPWFVRLDRCDQVYLDAEEGLGLV